MEQSFLAWIRGRMHALPQVNLGIGDDAAVLDWPSGQVVIATDGMVDGVDFLSDQHSLESIGHKAVAINLSDLAAMGAQPLGILVNLTLPETDPTEIAAGVYEGILACATEYGLAIVGGDISVYKGPLAIVVTILGTVDPGTAWVRSGAQQGDAIVVTGAFGGSILGRHLSVQPRIEAAKRLRQHVMVNAAMDVSDGLTLDLDRMCAASGVGAELDLTAIPVHTDAERLSIQDGGDAMKHALGDGEDFELLLAIPESQVDQALQVDVGVPLTKIGRFIGRTGLWSKEKNSLVRLPPSGYVHG